MDHEVEQALERLEHRIDEDIRRLRASLAHEERERMHLEDTVRRLERSS